MPSMFAAERRALRRDRLPYIAQVTATIAGCATAAAAVVGGGVLLLNHVADAATRQVNDTADLSGFRTVNLPTGTIACTYEVGDEVTPGHYTGCDWDSYDAGTFLPHAPSLDAKRLDLGHGTQMCVMAPYGHSTVLYYCTHPTADQTSAVTEGR